MSRPVVGICCSTEVARWSGWEVLANVSPRSYSLSVQAAGAVAVLLPPDDAAAESPDDVLDLVDALVLAGGSDIDPASYGARQQPEVKLTWPERDRFELALTHRALERVLEERYLPIPDDDEADVTCSGRIPKPAHSVRRCLIHYPGGAERRIAVLTNARGAEVLSKP